MDQHALRKKVSNFLLHQDPEKISDLQVNSRSSSFQEGMSDTDRFRVVLKIFRDLWKAIKRALMKT